MDQEPSLSSWQPSDDIPLAAYGGVKVSHAYNHPMEPNTRKTLTRKTRPDENPLCCSQHLQRHQHHSLRSPVLPLPAAAMIVLEPMAGPISKVAVEISDRIATRDDILRKGESGRVWCRYYRP